jgi:hypothetical protein
MTRPPGNAPLIRTIKNICAPFTHESVPEDAEDIRASTGA